MLFHNIRNTDDKGYVNVTLKSITWEGGGYRGDSGSLWIK